MSAPDAASNERTLRIEGMTCAACQSHVQRALAAVPGVESASVNLMAHTAHVASANPIDDDTLIAAVRGAGYDAYAPEAASAAHHHDHDAEETGNLGLRAGLSLAAGAVAMTLSMPLMMAPETMPAGAHAMPANDPLLAGMTRVVAPLMPAVLMSLPAQPVRWLLAVLALAVMLFAAREIYTAAWRAARHRATNMNTLVALGTIAAFASSFAATVAPGAFARRGLASDVYYEAVILILAFLLCGRWLEARARSRATSALRGFANLEAKDVRLLTLPAAASASDYASAPETVLPLDAIETGDVLRVLPGERVPVDGVILYGRSSLDESMLKGEPLPVSRGVNERVSAGTLNLDGALVLRATAVGAASTLAQMQRLLAQAQSSRAPLERLADQASAIFVPAVLGLAAITFAAWSLALNSGGRHEGFARPFAVAIAVLIIACPCAMGLAVPAAITVAIGRAAQVGLLIKGGDALERLATVDTIALDKTGTLTEGRPHIALFNVADDAPLKRGELLAYAVAVERLSTHPLAQAVVAFASQQTELPSSPLVEDFRNLPGVGLTASIGGHSLAIGNATLLDGAKTTGLTAPAELAHATPLYVVVDGKPVAAFFAVDTLRSTAPDAVRELSSLHVAPVLLTGDIAASAAPIAREAGIAEVRAHLMPAEKLAAIRALQNEGRRVAMVGDGINDAAALAQADAGLAMAAGTDLAREAGDVLLLHTDLRLIPASVRIARRTTRIMRQNLGWAMAYNALGLPIAAGVLYPHFHILLSPVLASAAMALSSVSVLANSLRLRNAAGVGASH